MLTPTLIKVAVDENTSGSVFISEHLPLNAKEEGLGRLICVISTKRHQEMISSQVAAREIFLRLVDAYYKSEVSPFNSLKNAAESVVNSLSLTWGEVEMIVVSYVGGVLYSVVYGFSQVSILRQKTFAPILVGKGELVSASGYPKEGDFLILGTKDFFESIPPSDFSRELHKENGINQNSFLQFFKPESPLFGAGIVFFATTGESITETPRKDIKQGLEIGGKIRSIVAKLSGFVKWPKSGREIYIKGVGVSEYESGGKKVTLTVGIILVGLLLVSIVFGVRQRSTRLRRATYETRLTQAEHEFAEALSLFTINPERSRELFLSSREIAFELKEENVKDEKLEELLPKIEENQGFILGEYEAGLQNFVDLPLLSNGFVGSDLASSGEEVFILDKASKKIARVNIANKRSEVVAGPEDFNSAGQIISYEDRFFVLGDDGVHELGDSENRIDKDWEGEVLGYSYAGNIYILEKQNPNIWRFPGVSGGFSGRQSWLGSGLTFDFSDAVSLSIDGSMWILRSSGDVLKLTFGTVDTFNINGVPETLEGSVNIYTNEENEYVYVLDPSRSRMVVLDKKGEFKAQYIGEDLKNANDLVVSEGERKAVVLVNGNLKVFELGHL